jgi:hypothetical protein
VLICALIKGWRMRPTAGWRYFTSAAAVTAVFLSEPQVWFPHTNNRELGWAWWEQIIGSAYVWVGLVALCAFAFRPGHPSDAPPGPGSGPALETRPRADQPEADPKDEAEMERLTKEASAGVGTVRRC